MEFQVLDALIDRQLVQQEVQRLELDITDTELERALSDIARQNGLEREQLQQEIQRSGLAWDSYLDEIRSSLREMKFNQQVLSPRVSVREDELRDLYRRSVADYTDPPRVHLQGLFVPFSDPDTPESRAQGLAVVAQARKDILAGTPFADLASRLSVEPYASRGGDMGMFARGELVAELDGPAFSMSQGELSQPIVTAQGVFLLRVLEIVESTPPTFDDLKEQLRTRIMEGKMQDAREQWLAQARRRAALKILLEPAG